MRYEDHGPGARCVTATVTVDWLVDDGVHRLGPVWSLVDFGLMRLSRTCSRGRVSWPARQEQQSKRREMDGDKDPGIPRIRAAVGR